jgi:hypothetical protein
MVDPSKRLRVVEGAIGVETGFTRTILVFVRMSWMYLYWDRCRPSECHVASTLRKKWRGKRSLSAKDEWRSLMNLEIATRWELVKMISSTYINTKIVMPNVNEQGRVGLGTVEFQFK